jgi:hypothetical protein
MQTFNIINYIDILDLSLLNFIDYLDVIEDSYHISDDDGLLHLALTGKNKKILTELIINNINNNLQFGAINIIINTCKPMQNWRQTLRGNAVRSYKCKLIDSSIKIDEIQFNQFIDSIFKKISKQMISKTSANNTIFSIHNKYNIKYIDSETIDINDFIFYLKRKLIYLGNVNCNTLNYNNIIITDGNCDYSHSLECPDEIEETIRRNLLEKGIL